MNDRVQQMLDVVKDEFETAIRKPRRRRAKAMMRAEVREGILKNPLHTSGQKPGVAPNVRGLQGDRAGYSEPRHPDVWRNTSIRGTDLPAHAESGRGIDPAEAALAAFHDARSRPNRKGMQRSAFEAASIDRPRMDEEPVKPRGRKARRRINRRIRDRDEVMVDARNGPAKRRGSWIRALTGSRKRR